MFDLLKPFLSRIAGSIAGAIVAFLSAHEIAVLSQNDVATIVAFILVVFQVVYAIVHRLIDKKVNPTDSAVTPPPTA